MQELKVTTPGPDGHYHIVYINSETGVGATSPAIGKGSDGHEHELIFDPPRPPREPTPAIPPAIDPMTGAPMIDPATGQPDMGQPADPGDPGKEEGEWIVRPASVQNAEVQSTELHDHELTEYVPEEKKSTENEKDIIEECMALWREGLAISSNSRKKGREAEDFRAGKQWDDYMLRGLNQLDRAALTINEIAKNIDTLIGYQMEQRTDLRYLPTEAGDQRIADILNVVSKKILDNCYYQREKTKVFTDQCVPGMGVFLAYMDFNKNIQGEIKIQRFPFDDIVYGPHEQEDLSDNEFEVRSRMQSIAWLKQRWGKKAEKIQQAFNSYSGQLPNEKTEATAGTNTDYNLATPIDELAYTVDGSFPLVDVQKKQMRFVECSRKIYQEVTVIFNVEENFFHTAYDWKEKDIEAAAKIPGFQVISQMKPRIRITKFCGNVVLSDENPADLPLHDFYTVPAYCYRQNGEWWGKVEAAKDPQRELNKRRSQAMDTMNRLGASVYYVEPDTFVNPQEKERFKKNRSKPGAMFDVNTTDRRPVLEEGAEFPAALVQIMQMDQENLQRLMNVIIMQGGANESGALFLEKKKGQLTGNQFLIDNLSFAEQKLGKIIAALIQRYYTPERIERMLNSQYSRQKFKIAGKDYAEFNKDEILELLTDADLSEYDVIVAESSFAPSTRMGIAIALWDAIAKGADIPLDLPFEFMDIPSDVLTRITERTQAAAEAAAQQAATTSDTEIKKTLLAKGQYTVSPEEAQKLNLIPVNAPLQAAPQMNNDEQDAIQATKLAENLAGPLAG